MSVKTLRPFIIILLLLVIVAAWQYRGNQQRPSIVTQTRLEALVAGSIKAEAINKVVLYSAASPEETVELARDGEAWKIATLHNAPADSKKVSDFLATVIKLKGEPRAVAKNDAELAPYGLKDGDGFRLRAYTDPAADPAIDLVVGKSPDFRTVFMRKAGDMRVYVEAANLRRDAGVFSDDAEAVPGDEHWLDKTVLALDREQVKRIALDYPDKRLDIQQVTIEEPAVEAPEPADGEEAAPPPPPVTRTEWQVAEGGAGLTFKQTGLNSLLTKLTAFTCTSVVDPANKPEYGLDDPAFRLLVGLEDGTETTILAARPEPTGKAYAMIEGVEKDIVYELDGSTFEQLFPKGQTLFDLPALTIDRDDIESIEITQPEGRVVVAKVGDEWQVTEPALGLAQQDALVTTLVSTLGNWRPADFADVGAAIGDESRSITIRAGEATHILRGAGDVPGQDAIYIRQEGVDTPLVMARTDIARLFLKPRDVFQLTLLNVDEDEVRNVLIKTANANFALERGEGGWLARVGGVEHAVDADTAEQFVTNLATLQADDIRTDRPNIGGDPILNLGIRTSESLPRYLAIGPEEDGHHLISLSGLNSTFEIDTGTVAALAGLVSDLTPGATETTAEPAEPTDAVEPTDPADPTAPADPAASAEPTTPADPSAPADPTASAEPTTPADPSAPSDPSESSPPADTAAEAEVGETTPAIEDAEVQN